MDVASTSLANVYDELPSVIRFNKIGKIIPTGFIKSGSKISEGCLDHGNSSESSCDPSKALMDSEAHRNKSKPAQTEMTQHPNMRLDSSEKVLDTSTSSSIESFLPPSFEYKMESSEEGLDNCTSSCSESLLPFSFESKKKSLLETKGTDLQILQLRAEMMRLENERLRLEAKKRSHELEEILRRADKERRQENERR